MGRDKESAEAEGKGVGTTPGSQGMSLFRRDKAEAWRDKGVLLLLLHMGSKWRWDSGDGAGNSRSVQLPFLSPLLFHSPSVLQHVWEIPSQALSMLPIPALCPACRAWAQHRSSPSLSGGGVHCSDTPTLHRIQERGLGAAADPHPQSFQRGQR